MTGTWGIPTGKYSARGAKGCLPPVTPVRARTAPEAKVDLSRSSSGTCQDGSRGNSRAHSRRPLESADCFSGTAKASRAAGGEASPPGSRTREEGYPRLRALPVPRARRRSRPAAAQLETRVCVLQSPICFITYITIPPSTSKIYFAYHHPDINIEGLSR